MEYELKNQIYVDPKPPSQSCMLAKAFVEPTGTSVEVHDNDEMREINTSEIDI